MRSWPRLAKAALVSDLDPDDFAALRNQMAKQWGPHAAVNHPVYPLRVQVRFRGRHHFGLDTATVPDSSTSQQENHPSEPEPRKGRSCSRQKKSAD